jgi:LEA14-like dessication related protein
MRRAYAWLLLGLLWAGCASISNDDSVQVSLVNLTSGDATPWETTLVFTVRIQNAMPDAIIVTGGAHKIYLDGSYIGQGLSNSRVEIPRLGDATQEVTVRLHNWTLARALVEISKKGDVQYEVRSTIYIDRGGHNSTIKTSRQGSMSLKDFSVPPA